MADGLSVSCNDNGVASTIPDDRPMPSIKNEAFPFMFLNELVNWFAGLWTELLLLHGKILLGNSWRVDLSLFDFVGASEFVQLLNQVWTLEGDV